MRRATSNSQFGAAASGVCLKKAQKSSKAMRRASSRVGKLAAVRRPGSLLEIDVGQLPVGVAHNEARLGFFGRPGRREAAALTHHVLPVHGRAASKISKAPGMTRANTKSRNGVMWIMTTSLREKEPAKCGYLAKAERRATPGQRALALGAWARFAGWLVLAILEAPGTRVQRRLRASAEF
jgi:hypothetical protein